MASTQWRLNITAVDGAEYINVSEIEMRIAVGGADQCTGGTASSSDETNYLFEAYKAFDNYTNSWWYTNNTSGWIKYTFDTDKEIVEYTVASSVNPTGAPKDWTFEYWNGADWVVVDTITNQTGWSAEETRTFRTVVLQASIIGDGGVVFGGESTIGIHSVKAAIVGDGGIIFGGSVVFNIHNKSLSIVGDGGIVLGGSAEVYCSYGPLVSTASMVGAGGVVFGGTAVQGSDGFVDIDLSQNPTILEIFNAILAAVGIATLGDLPAFTVDNTSTAIVPTLSDATIAAVVAVAPTNLGLPTLAAPVALAANGTDVTTTYELPPAPSMTLPEFTAMEPTLSNIEMPEAPTIVLPDVPSYAELTIPTPDAIVYPEFTATLELPTLTVPTAEFSFSEAVYTSSTLTAVIAKLLTDVVSGTGIASGVESGIWSREANRSAAVLTEVQGILSAFGFVLPAAIATGFGKDVTDHKANLQATANRTRTVTNAEAEQKHRQAARDAAIELEDKLMTYYSQMNSRALQSAEIAADLAKRAYAAAVLKFVAEIAGYRSQAQAFTARVEAELEKVNVFKAQVEAARATNTLNRAQIESYKAQVKGILSAVDIFKIQVEAVNTFAQVQTIRIELFKTKVEAYNAQVRVILAVAKMKAAILEGETAKIDIYKNQVGEYRARVREIVTLIEARTIALRKAIEEYRVLLDEFQAQIRGLAADVSANETVSAVTIQMEQAASDLNASRIEQAARIKQVSAQQYALEEERLRDAYDALSMQIAQAVRQLETEGRVNVTEVRAAFQNLSEINAAIISRVSAHHAISYSETFERIDMAQRLSAASIYATAGLDPFTGQPHQIAGF